MSAAATHAPHHLPAGERGLPHLDTAEAVAIAAQWAGPDHRAVASFATGTPMDATTTVAAVREVRCDLGEHHAHTLRLLLGGVEPPRPGAVGAETAIAKPVAGAMMRRDPDRWPVMAPACGYCRAALGWKVRADAIYCGGACRQRARERLEEVSQPVEVTDRFSDSESIMGLLHDRVTGGVRSWSRCPSSRRAPPGLAAAQVTVR